VELDRESVYSIWQTPIPNRTQRTRVFQARRDRLRGHTAQPRGLEIVSADRLDVEYKRRDFRPCLRLPPVTVRDVHRISTRFDLRILCLLRVLLLQDETNTRHPLFANAYRLSGEGIVAAIEVHRIMGPGSRLVLPGANNTRTEGNEGNEGENRD
jgi:hypothetical protein